ncbi:PIN domain-containing protein [Aurantimonas sp. A2-1-M11]|uniref:type II toxin-antitoxin system VapC family toxin n=1 Tax=Aurantimonas sp. A2-1-M11 TaxID=3113712 RepID=UPI002F95DDCE
MILVDASVWIAILRGEDTRAVALLRQATDLSEIRIADLTLFRVLAGARDDRDADRIARYLRQFPIVPVTGERPAERAAGLVRILRSHGIALERPDAALIAAHSIARGHAVLHDDPDMAALAAHCGLRTA